MADSIDAKTRAIETMKAKEGEEMSVLQAAQNQLLNIQAEQRQNLAMSRAQNKAEAQQNALVSQAAGLVGGEGQVQAPINSATQSVLGKYGMNKSTVTKQQVKRENQNIIINNYNNTTYNNAGSGIGPLQGRPVVVNPNQGNELKFKVWVDNLMARQNEQAALRDREYERKESALTRSANKMTRKLESLGNTVSKRMDPRRISGDLYKQLRTLMFLFGFGYLAKNWDTILTKAVNIEEKFTNITDFFGITKSNGGRDTSRFVKGIKRALGVKEDDNVTFLGSLKQFFVGDGSDKDGGLLGLAARKIDGWLNKRSKALGALKKPDISILNINEGLNQMLQYFGQALQVLFGGSEGLSSVMADNFKGAYNKATGEHGTYMGSKHDLNFSRDIAKVQDNLNKEGKADLVSAGDLEYYYRGAKDPVFYNGDLDGNKLSNNMGASIAQSNMLAKTILSESGDISLGKTTMGLDMLTESIKNFGSTLVSNEFLNALDSLGIDTRNLRRKFKKYKFVKVPVSFLSDKMTLKLVPWEDERPAVKFPNPISDPYKVTHNAGSGQSALASIGASMYGNKDFQVDKNYQDYLGFAELTGKELEDIRSQIAKKTGKSDFSFNMGDSESIAALAKLLKENGKTIKDDKITKDLFELPKVLDRVIEYEKAVNKRTEEQLSDNTALRAADNWSNAFSNSTQEESSPSGRSSNQSGQFKTQPKESTSTEPSKAGKRLKNTGKFDKGKALLALMNNTFKSNKKKGGKKESTKSTGYCARYVHAALSEGFGQPVYDMTVSNGGEITAAAYESTGYLDSLGFQRIPITGDIHDFPYEAGDVLVWGPSKNHNAGHIQMFDGTQWISDFKQGSIEGSRTRGDSIPTLFRYKGDLVDSRTGSEFNQSIIGNGIASLNSSLSNALSTHYDLSGLPMESELATPNYESVGANLKTFASTSTEQDNIILLKDVLAYVKKIDITLNNSVGIQELIAQGTAANVDATSASAQAIARSNNKVTPPTKGIVPSYTEIGPGDIGVG